MTAETWDAVVVGAGPAGSVTAKLLSEGGHRVLLLDRAEFPRSKPCGESVNPGAVRELEHLGLLTVVRALPHREVTGWKVTPAVGRPFEGRFPPGDVALAVDRCSFDGVLLDAALGSGVELRTSAQVVDLVRKRERIVGVATRDGGEIAARIVVGADGLRSVVVRRLGLLRRQPKLRKIGLTAHVRGAVLPPGTGELHVTEWGCAGVAEVASGVANVAVVLDVAEAGRLGVGAAEAFDQFIREIPPLWEASRSSEVLTTGPFDWPTSEIVADGALLVGDAAGYFDPFTGQGIYRALRGARLAADAIGAALQRDDLSRASLRSYGVEHRRSFTGGVRVQHVIEGALSRPRIFRIAARLLAGAPALANRLVAVTGDLSSPSSLFLPTRSASL